MASDRPHDVPTLSHSAAMREATPQTPYTGFLHDHRPGNHRTASSHSITKTTDDLPHGYTEHTPWVQRTLSGSELPGPAAVPLGPALDLGIWNTPLPCFHSQGVLQEPVWHCAHTRRSDTSFVDSNEVKPTTEIRAGAVQKPFAIPTDLLVSKSPFFAALSEDPLPKSRLSGPYFYPDLDEFAFTMFVHWIHGGELHGPNDFHSMNHYLCLYILAQKFKIESLKNTTMDLIRAYYRSEGMTAPAFRVQYIYSYTDGPCLMRDFLVSTAAYRALSETDKAGVSESLRSVLKAGGDVAADFAAALVRIIWNDREDVRLGDPCKWHEHNVTPKCAPAASPEPYQST